MTRPDLPLAGELDAEPEPTRYDTPPAPAEDDDAIEIDVKGFGRAVSLERLAARFPSVDPGALVAAFDAGAAEARRGAERRAKEKIARVTEKHAADKQTAVREAVAYTLESIRSRS